MRGNPGAGARYLLRGFAMLNQPGIRRYVAIPVTVNIVVFVTLISLAVGELREWMALLVAWLPEWLTFLSWLLWPLAILLMLVVVFYSFSIVANLIASPFNGLLAEKVELLLTSQTPPDSGGAGITGLIKDVPRAVGKELRKLAYYLPRALLVLIVMLVPLVNVVAPLLWFLLGSWMMALSYCDYPMDNHRYSLHQVRARIASRRLTSLGFGAAVMVGTMIPFVNFLIMPAAICGATLYWVERLREQPPNRIASD